MIISLLQLAHASMRRLVKPGAMLLDATAGNGHDTLLLAELAGGSGQVLAFEPQALARRRAARRMAQAGWLERVRFIDDGHENLAQYVSVPLDAAIFNLGFLPGSDRKLTTKADTTLAALNALTPLLKNGGLISVHCYSGHEAGQEESRAVLAWAKKLAPEQWQVLRYETLNKRHNPENLLLIYRI